jgi:hypothetical protein
MKVEDFAAFIGHGVAIVKKVEAGSRRLTDRMVTDIHDRTRVPLSVLMKPSLADADVESLPTTIPIAAYGGFGAQHAAEAVVGILPSIFALYCSLVTAGVNPQLALIPLQREIDATLSRWKIDRESFELFDFEAVIAILGVRGDRQGIDQPAATAVIEKLKSSPGGVAVERAGALWSTKLDKIRESKASRRHGLTAVYAELDRQEQKARGRAAGKEV